MLLKEISGFPSCLPLMAETLQEELDLPAQIKWPNDILINKKKIAGILSEAITDMDGIEFVVIGMGLNINNAEITFRMISYPSYLGAGGKRAERIKDKNLAMFAGKIGAALSMVQAGDFTEILAAGRRLSMVIGQQVSLETNQGLVTGRAVDIDEMGFAGEDGSGTLHTVISGSLRLSRTSKRIDLNKNAKYC
jgi:BirA family biotin operon repressor/biotin-[acetyl-CoA-carboxylase] ligase